MADSFLRENPGPVRFETLRNPPWVIRVAATALTTAMPGVLLGAGSALFLGDFAGCSLTGGLIGMLLGMTLEAPVAYTRPGDDDESDIDGTIP